MDYEQVRYLILASIIAAIPYALGWIMIDKIANYRGVCMEIVPRQWYGLVAFGSGVILPASIYGTMYHNYWAFITIPLTSVSLLVQFLTQRWNYNKLHSGEQWAELSPDGPFFPVARDHLHLTLREKYGRTTTKH